MKNRILAIGIFSLGLLFTGCDNIEAPYTVQGPNGCSVPQPTFTPRTTHERKVLLEEFTGHRCGNCPRGAETVTNIDAAHPGQVIAIAHHTYNIDYFTAPLSSDISINPEQHYLYDFRTQESKFIDEKFGVNTAGIPSGFVDRKNFGSGVLLTYGSWANRTNTELALAPVMDIQVQAYWTPTENSVCAYYFVEVLEAMTGNYNIMLYLTEDDIEQWQKDYNATPNDIEGYTHNHIMRKAINGVSGTPLTAATTLSAGETYGSGYSVTIDPSKYNVNNLHIVAFVVNNDNNQVMQAEMVKLIP